MNMLDNRNQLSPMIPSKLFDQVSAKVLIEMIENGIDTWDRFFD